MFTRDPALALEIATRVAACGVAIAALELLRIRPQFGSGGVFSLAAVWPLERPGAWRRFLDGRIVLLLRLQFAAATTLALFGPFSTAGRAALLVTIAAALAARWRRHLGGDGAEQMAMLVLIAAALATLPSPGETRTLLAVVFIAAQLILSYVTAGVAKLLSPAWRDGSALPAVLNTYSHGHPWASALLGQRRAVAVAVCWFVILFESSFPLLLAGPGWVSAGALGFGLGFHATCAVLMGLNGFLWSFPAAYPCVIVAAAAVRPLVH